MAQIEVVVPDMGNFAEVGVIDVLVKPGDRVEVDTPLVTLETEKATMDVPSTAAGIGPQNINGTGRLLQNTNFYTKFSANYPLFLPNGINNRSLYDWTEVNMAAPNPLPNAAMMRALAA